jgi:hypothetical protein
MSVIINTRKNLRGIKYKSKHRLTANEEEWAPTSGAKKMLPKRRERRSVQVFLELKGGFMKRWVSHAAQKAILVGVICMGTIPLCASTGYATTVIGYSGDQLSYSNTTIYATDGMWTSIAIEPSTTDYPNVLNSSITLDNVTTRGNMFGSYADSIVGGSAIGNSITATNSTLFGRVICGYVYESVTNGSGVGNATNNSISLTNSNVSGNYNIIGGYTVEGVAANNSIIINNSTISARRASNIDSGVYGGRAMYGSAENNTVIITDSTVNIPVYGGYKVVQGTATGNNVTATNSTLTMLVVGGFGGNNGDALENSVTLTNSNATEDVYGAWAIGWGDSGNASDNTVSVVDSSTVDGSVYGGYVSGTGDATSNSVVINDSSIGESVYGGWSRTGDASDNSVTLTSSTVSANAYGGYVKTEGDATGNTVTLTSSSVSEGIYGGYTASSGDASDNVVSLSSNSDAVYVYGGRAVTGNAENNTVSISESESANVYGGYVSSSGDVSGNTVTISDSATMDGYDGFAIGGYTYSGNATGNTVSVSSTDMTGVIGGESYSNGDAAENTVILDNVVSTFSDSGEYGGGWAVDGNATNNTLIATNTTAVMVYGGAAMSGNASGNTVELTSSTVASEYGMVYGGYVRDSGDATDNTVTVTDSTLNDVYGGYSGTGDASDNTVTISASTTDDIYGGYTVSGDATDNTVTLDGTVDVGDLFGGYTTGSGDVVTGNTLNVTGLNSTADSIQNFDSINFYVPAGTSNGDTMLTVSGTTTIPSTGLTATAYVNGSVVLNPGEEITLLSGAIDTTGTLSTAVSGTVYQGVSTTSTAAIETRTENDSGDYIKLIVPESEDTTLNEQTKSLVETPTYTAALVASGGDFLVDSALWNAAKAVKLNSDWTWTPFVAAAYKNMRYNTGSHVESDGWNTVLGIARRYEDKSGSFLVGPFVEYGNGDYDSYIDGGIHANGNAHYIGGGIFAQKNFNSGWYIDGSVRGGRVSADYNSNDLLIGTTRVHEDYDYRTPYYGFHLGFGKVHNYGDNVRLDTYLRYLYAHQDSFDAKLATGENYEFDDVDSSKIRIGTRYIHDEKDLGSWYVGAAYQYEFDNESTAHFGGGDTPNPSVQGSSGMMELGWEGKGGKNMIYDLSLRGWIGKEEGASVRALVKWTF